MKISPTHVAAVVAVIGAFAAGLIGGKVLLAEETQAAFTPASVAIGALAAQTGLKVFEVKTEKADLEGAFNVTVGAEGETNQIRILVIPTSEGGYGIADAQDVPGTESESDVVTP